MISFHERQSTSSGCSCRKTPPGPRSRVEQQLDQDPVARAAVELSKARENFFRTAAHCLAVVQCTMAIYELCLVLPWTNAFISASFTHKLFVGWCIYAGSFMSLKCISEGAVRATITTEDYLMPWPDVRQACAGSALVMAGCTVIVHYEMAPVREWLTANGLGELNWADPSNWAAFLGMAGLYCLGGALERGLTAVLNNAKAPNDGQE